jgi:hypothetical protein
MPEERLIYGCIGADRLEAEPFIDEVDGVLYYTCPACRLTLGSSTPRRPEVEAGCRVPATTWPSPRL